MQAFVILEAIWVVMDGRSTSRAERTEEMTGSVPVTVVGFGFRVYGLGFRVRETRKIPEISEIPLYVHIRRCISRAP